MKLIYTLLALAFIAAGANAAVLTVNNNTPTPGQYSTISAAQTAASPGDTLLISGSPYNYNSITIIKSLTLIGTGHKPLGDFPSVSKLDYINFSGTNTNLYDCRFIGLDVERITYDIGYVRRGYISRCKIRDYIAFNESIDSITIEGNFFESIGTNLYSNYTGYYMDNITVKNNVFNGNITNIYPNSGGNNIYFDNNVFLYNGGVFVSNNRYHQYRNNIFYRANPNSSISNSQFYNNIQFDSSSSTTTFPVGTSSNTGSGNLTNTNPLFVSGAASGVYYDYTQNYNLQSTSPAINAGTDGKDIGLTGGSGYFQRFGIPNIPQINQFSITSPANATVAPGGTLQISVMSTITR